MARRRKLRPEEEALWNAVARTASPMHAPLFQPKAEVAETPPAVMSKPPAPPMRLQPFRLGEKKQNPAVAAKPVVPLLNMDAKAYGKMTRGKLTPEARIDLHGMTLAEAHPELIRFILNAHSDGLRLVLVITGKGKPGADHGPIPQRAGVLRHQLPHWLRQVPLSPVILQVNEAHLRHGGSGAYYVYLKRQR
jgi:DNA-nicking Smr family endonuclease